MWNYDKFDPWHINHILGFITPFFLDICLMNMAALQYSGIDLGESGYKKILI